MKKKIDKQLFPKPMTKAQEKKAKDKLIKELTKICSCICSKNAKGLCEICGKIGNASHHIFSKKAFPHLRFDLKNLIWVCFFCHIRKIHQQAQGELARDSAINRATLAEFEDLKQKAYNPLPHQKTYSLANLEDTLIELKKDLCD
jgi:5-methylcytosine-specific restriction endonuclease McrA